jgi:hypothetical protein
MRAPAVVRTQSRVFRRFALSVLSLWLASCNEKPPEPALASSSEPSPNASILPAPLASGLEGKNQLLHDAGEKEVGVRDAGKLASNAGEVVPLKDPVFAREDRAFSRDGELLDLSGLSLSARFRWPDVPLPSRLPDANVEAIQRARNNATFDLTIDLSPSGRMRFAFASERFLVPVNTELRARYDIYGHAVVMPDRARYTVAVPGSLRALLNERRLDTLPLVAPRAVGLGAWQSLGFNTQKSRFSSPLGQLDLEQAEVIESGLGGLLLCRLLVELVGVHPATPVCAEELVPIRADYAWTEGGRFGFEVTALRPVTGFDGSDLAVPPARAEHRIGGLIEPSTPFLVAPSEFKNFRVRALRTPERRDSESPKEGLLVLNAGELPTYFLIDGVPVLRLPAKGAEVLLDLRAGTYSASARDFLSADVNPPTMTAVPARIVVSEAPKTEP